MRIMRINVIINLRTDDYSKSKITRLDVHSLSLPLKLFAQGQHSGEMMEIIVTEITVEEFDLILNIADRAPDRPKKSHFTSFSLFFSWDLIKIGAHGNLTIMTGTNIAVKRELVYMQGNGTTFDVPITPMLSAKRKRVRIFFSLAFKHC